MAAHLSQVLFTFESLRRGGDCERGALDTVFVGILLPGVFGWTKFYQNGYSSFELAHRLHRRVAPF